MTDRPRLRDRGQIYVTMTAARTYAEAEGLRIEEARRELTELLLYAREMAPATETRPASYRYRSRADGVDISATVSLEGELWIVVSINVRDVPER